VVFGQDNGQAGLVGPGTTRPYQGRSASTGPHLSDPSLNMAHGLYWRRGPKNGDATQPPTLAFARALHILLFTIRWPVFPSTSFLRP
jgi:hypothetical protein